MRGSRRVARHRCAGPWQMHGRRSGGSISCCVVSYHAAAGMNNQQGGAWGVGGGARWAERSGAAAGCRPVMPAAPAPAIGQAPQGCSGRRCCKLVQTAAPRVGVGCHGVAGARRAAPLRERSRLGGRCWGGRVCGRLKPGRRLPCMLRRPPICWRSHQCTQRHRRARRPCAKRWRWKACINEDVEGGPKLHSLQAREAASAPPSAAAGPAGDASQSHPRGGPLLRQRQVVIIVVDATELGESRLV